MEADHELLRRARVSKADWGHDEVIALYVVYGFEIRNGSKHDVVVHPQYPNLRATVARHKSLATGYVSTAVRLIDALIARKQGRNGNEPRQ